MVGGAWRCLMPISIAFQGLLHHLADIGKTSSPLGVFTGAVADSRLLAGHDLLHQQRSSVRPNILFNIHNCIIETVTNFFGHQAISTAVVGGPVFILGGGEWEVSFQMPALGAD
jgi:hypothetical protein